MIFALVKISGSRTRDHTYAYQSMIMEIGVSAKWTKNFQSEDEMKAVVIRLMAKQWRPYDLRRVIDQIRVGGYYFFDLDLTAEEAESLGFPRTSKPVLHSSQMRPTCDSSRFQQRRT
jgi:hypothetical protein